MARSKNLSTIFNTIFPFADFLYILQQEEYNTRRYLKWLPRFFWRRNFQVRDRLKYTMRTRLTLIFTVALWLALLGSGLALMQDIFYHIVLIIVWLVAIPGVVLVGNLILTPAFNMMKQRVFRKATEKVAHHKNLKIITVAGSFGKTTTKNFIGQLVKHVYRTQMVSGNINTPLGIAQWIVRELRVSTELLIVEIDGYKKEEFTESAGIVPADIAIITNIGDQHLERFGSKENLGEALREIFCLAKSGAVLITNAETAKELKQIPFDRYNKVAVVSPEDGGELAIIPAGKLDYLSASGRANLAFAVKAAHSLDVPDDFIIHACEHLETPDRRQKITEMYGYEAVDDSYNISFTTARAGVTTARELAKAKGKKLLAITAGIPELGPADLDNNRALGELLARNADHVIILKTIFAGEIAKGVGEDKTEKYGVYASLKDFVKTAHAIFPPSQWVLFVEPELTDLYY